jgi:putative oxidoreductase
MTFAARIAASCGRAVTLLGFLAPVVDLAVRLWVAQVFFRSGMLKLASWETTQLLFANEYHVPFLPPNAAAVMGTGTELIVPLFLAFGLGGRVAAFVLFVFNAIAVVSYPELEGIGLEQHYVWGLLLLVTLVHGPGTLSLDHLVGRWLGGRTSRGAPLATAR